MAILLKLLENVSRVRFFLAHIVVLHNRRCS